jgi:hypothetical protein
VGIVFTSHAAGALVDVEPDAGVVAGVVDPEPGWVVEVEEVDDEDVVGRVVDTLVVLVAGATIGASITGPGLTCSPAAATICQASTVVRAVAATQIAMRPNRFTPEVSQQAVGYRINGLSRFSQGGDLPR